MNKNKELMNEEEYLYGSYIVPVRRKGVLEKGEEFA